MASFDDIMKKGKQAAIEPNMKDQWKDCLRTVLTEIHRLNDMYGDKKTHHLAIEQKRCEGCNICTFTVVARDFKDHKLAIRFHKANWKCLEGKYFCDTCKKGK